MSHDARAVANVMIEKGVKDKNPLDPIQIIKLTYLCQAWMLTMFGRKIFRQEIHAWEHGPVVADVYESLFRYGASPIKKRIKGVEKPKFDEQETHIMNQVYDIYGHWTGAQLSRATHLPGTPWYKTRSENPLGRDNPIPQNLMREYYGEKLRRHQSESAT